MYNRLTGVYHDLSHEQQKTGMSIQVGDGFGVNMTYICGSESMLLALDPCQIIQIPKKEASFWHCLNSPKKYWNSKHAITKNMIAASVDVWSSFHMLLEHITTAVWLTKGSGQIVYITTPKSEIMMTYETIMGIIIIIIM